MPTARDCAALLLETLPVSMRILGGAIHTSHAPEDRPLNMGQLRMLELLRRHPWTLGDLAERHHVAASTMSRTVDVLVRRAWVERRSHPEDRRQILLCLTDAGLAAHSEMRRRAEDTITRLIEQLPEEERDRLYDGLRVLQRLAANATAHGTE
ncbi:MAG TPA: MarR family transcriptional regulator [Roseiflexaceae bacterium]|nr:MarR family transcriptional regulator [Roseiflexaceae bacterium]